MRTLKIASSLLLLVVINTPTTLAASGNDLKHINFYAEYTLPKENKHGELLASGCAINAESSKLIAEASISEFYNNKSVTSSEVIANKYTVKTKSEIVSKKPKTKLVTQSQLKNSLGLQTTCTLVKAL